MVAIDAPLSHKVTSLEKPMSAIGINGFGTGYHWEFNTAGYSNYRVAALVGAFE